MNAGSAEKKTGKSERKTSPTMCARIHRVTVKRMELSIVPEKFAAVLVKGQASNKEREKKKKTN